MSNITYNIPLSLYIHFPWCVKKCPYCDFNSHALKESLPEKAYIECLLLNLEQVLALSPLRPICSIFMGGGTPSLFSHSALEHLLKGIKERCELLSNIEITLEANPGTVESERFKGYFDIGINRLSLGVQSFNDNHLKTLGRIHNSGEAERAIETVRNAGFTNFNIDIMFGLPQQTLAEGLACLSQAISYEPTHLSWYELTLEPNTYFWHNPPPLPTEETVIALHEAGQKLLAEQGYQQYEVSAYSRQRPCQHNKNYWEFGDYLAIGAGAHAKITTANYEIWRLQHFKHPKQYMDKSNQFIQQKKQVTKEEIIFEYFLNALRLKEGVALENFTARTGCSLNEITGLLNQARCQGWLADCTHRLKATPLGYQFLNDLTALFLPRTS